MATIVFIQGGGAAAYDEDALLVESLRRELPEVAIEYPRMPDEDEPDAGRWSPAIAEAVARAEAPLILVGHSIGAYLLLRYLAEEPQRALAVCLIAAPFPSGDADWTFDGFELPDDFALALPERVLLYASEDDDTVPFAHRDLYAAAIPGAEIRTTTGGHQLGNDLSVVVADVRSILTPA